MTYVHEERKECGEFRAALVGYGDWDGVSENFDEATGTVLDKLWNHPEILQEFKSFMEAADTLEKKQPPSRPITLDEAIKLKAFCDVYLAHRASRKFQKGIQQRQKSSTEAESEGGSRGAAG